MRTKFHKRVMFGVVYGLILAVVTLAGIEFLSSFYSPSWPARALRAAAPITSVTALKPPFTEQPWLGDAQNSWGMRDREHTIAKPAGGAPRTVFVGDSLVESYFTPLSLPAAVERDMAASGRPIEAINLGISGTDPRNYYFRIRDVVLKLSPDAILLFIYAGNDFMAPNAGYSAWPALIGEAPGSSILGSIMPRTNWLLVNRLRLAQFFQGRAPAPPNEEQMLYDAVHAPPAEQLARLVSHVKKYHYPDLSEAQIAEVLSRGSNRYWHAGDQSEGEQEYLLGWMIDILMNWETRDFDVAKDRQDAARLAGNGEVEATLSWIEAADRLAREHKVPLQVFLAPVGTVDPEYAEFWKPWPRAYGWSYLCDEWQSRLVEALRKTNIRFVDLRDDLNGIPGTYRKLDGHWSQKGEAIVAERVKKELGTVLRR
jgi:lysophospholipase L1-like esterase